MKIYIEFIQRFQYRVFLENANGDQAHLNNHRSLVMASAYAHRIATLLSCEVERLNIK